MGTPLIPKDSETARALAQTLGTTAEALANKFPHEPVGQIDVRSLARSNYRGRIISLDQVLNHPQRCYITFIVDNGDGRAGRDDLLLSGYGSCRRGNPTMGFAKLFADDTRFQCSSGDERQSSAPDDVATGLNTYRGKDWKFISTEWGKNELTKLCAHPKS